MESEETAITEPTCEIIHILFLKCLKKENATRGIFQKLNYFLLIIQVKIFYKSLILNESFKKQISLVI